LCRRFSASSCVPAATTYSTGASSDVTKRKNRNGGPRPWTRRLTRSRVGGADLLQKVRQSGPAHADLRRPRLAVLVEKDPSSTTRNSRKACPAQKCTNGSLASAVDECPSAYWTAGPGRAGPGADRGPSQLEAALDGPDGPHELGGRPALPMQPGACGDVAMRIPRRVLLLETTTSSLLIVRNSDEMDVLSQLQIGTGRNNGVLLVLTHLLRGLPCRRKDRGARGSALWDMMILMRRVGRCVEHT
jgi:hypothetical protein